MKPPPRWFFYTLVSMVLFGGWGVVGKVLEPLLSPVEGQVLSTVALLPLIAVLLLRKREPGGRHRGKGIAAAFVGGVLAGLGNLAYLQTLAAGGAAVKVTPLTALYPVVTVLLALLFLGERLRGIQICGVALALGAIYAFNPITEWSALGGSWTLFALVPIGLWGVSALFQKISTSHVASGTSTLVFLAAFLVLAMFLAVTQPVTWNAPPKAWFWALLWGALFGVGNLALLVAYGQDGKASIVTPLSGLYSIVTIPLAILFLGERIDGQGLAGIILASLAVIALSREGATCLPTPESNSSEGTPHGSRDP